MSNKIANSACKGLVAAGIMLFLVLVGGRIYAGVRFNIDCSGRLKRAADANTLELAEKELTVALSHLEKEGLTTGYTSIVYQTPDEDIGFWYENLRSSRDELLTIMKKPERTPLENSNQLMKLRETLLDHGSEGSTKVTKPSGIAIYPNNGMWVVGVFAAFILAIIGSVGASSTKDRYSSRSSVTLIELLIIMTIVAIILVLAVGIAG